MCLSKDSFINLDQDLLKVVKISGQVESTVQDKITQKWIQIFWFYFLSLKIWKIVAICRWFHGNIFICLWTIAFWKKVCHKQVFSTCEKGAFFSVFEFFRKMPNFAGLWCPNHLTYRDSWGVYEKIISISFIWHLFFTGLHL